MRRIICCKAFTEQPYEQLLYNGFYFSWVILRLRT